MRKFISRVLIARYTLQFDNFKDVIIMIIIEELKQTPTEKQRVEIVERKIE